MPKSTIRLVWLRKSHTLADTVMHIKEKVDIECGSFSPLKTPTVMTTKLYQLLSVNDDEDIHLINALIAKNKDKRRQMASTSVRNLASHLCVVAYSNTRPTTEKWKQPKYLSRGAIELLKLLKNVTGSHFRPMLPAYILNEDCSSQYYFSSTQINDQG